MNLDLITVLMSVLCCNVIIIITGFLLSSDNVLIKIGYKPFYVLIFLILFRMACPFEFTGISRSIHLPAVMSRIGQFFFVDRTFAGRFSFEIWQTLFVIWGISCAVLLLKYHKNNLKLYNMISSYSEPTDIVESRRELIESILGRAYRYDSLHIVRCAFVDGPTVYYFKRQHFIMLPSGVSFSEGELNSIIVHETLHIKNHDLAVKRFIDILSIIYWWNPVCILFKDKAGLLLEIQVDQRSVEKVKGVSRDEYMSSLVSVARKVHLEKRAAYRVQAAQLAFTTRCGSLLSTRINYLVTKPERSKGISAGLCLVMFMIFIASYLYILEPHYVSFEDLGGGVMVSEENVYAVKKDDGTYDIYFDNTYVENADSLEYYPEDMKIYDKGSEAGNVLTHTAGKSGKENDDLHWVYKKLGGTLYRRLYDSRHLRWSGDWIMVRYQ